MKKVLLVFGMLLVTSSIFAAGKPALRVPATISEDTPEEQLVKVIFKKTVSPAVIDDSILASAFPWLKDKEEQLFLDSSLYKATKDRTVLLEAGAHRFGLLYNNGKSYTTSPAFLQFELEAGKSYSIISKVEGSKVSFDILDENGVSLTNPNNYSLFQKAVLQYVQHVLDPTAEGNYVKLRIMYDLHEYWYCGPDMSIIVENYQTKEKKTGYIGFQTDLNMSYAKIYIKYDEDGTMTKDDFLKLKPEECDRLFNFGGRANTASFSFDFVPVKPKIKGSKSLLVDCFGKIEKLPDWN